MRRRANVWFRSRVPELNARLWDTCVEQEGDSFVALERRRRVWQYAYSLLEREPSGREVRWLVYRDH